MTTKDLEKEIDFLKENSKLMLLKESSQIKLENSYFTDRMKGTRPEMFLRQSLILRLEESLKKLGPDYQILIFDGFRSLETQKQLYLMIFEEIREKNPTWTEAQVKQETRKFVADPSETSRFFVSPHNTGSAVDLTLCYKGSPLDMGTGFDDTTEKAFTTFFAKDFDSSCGIDSSRWKKIHENRMKLLKTLQEVGFTNYEEEWWHFDLGSPIWAGIKGSSSFYPSAEAELPSSS